MNRPNENNKGSGLPFCHTSVGESYQPRGENLTGAERKSLCYLDGVTSASKHVQVPEWEKFSC
uniref:Uncharacterized protein n=1 Tax=Lynx canadensis TaxID=61383 RepID=A0A667HYA0_LYNCA